MVEAVSSSSLGGLIEYIRRCTVVCSRERSPPLTAMHMDPDLDRFPNSALWVTMPFPSAGCRINYTLMARDLTQHVKAITKKDTQRASFNLALEKVRNILISLETPIDEMSLATGLALVKRLDAMIELVGISGPHP